jgi:MFS family permease
MVPLPERHPSALSALRHRNFRFYFAVQAVSAVGTWVQITVENWLVLELSHSGVALGVTNALQFGPSVLLGLYGGVVADRHDRRRLLMATQSCLGLLALTLSVLAGLGTLRVWMIWSAAAMLGLVKCFDQPALQSFVKDLVGPADLPNAVAWTNAVSATGRMVGPMLGGLILAGLGAAPGFAINAASFALVVLVLATLNRSELAPRRPVGRLPGQIRQGLVYMRRDPVLAATSLVMIVIFVAAYNFQVAIALIARDMPAGDGRTYGILMSTLGLGAVIGSLMLARAPTGLPLVLAGACALALAQGAVAAVQSPLPLAVAIFAYGVGAGVFSVAVIGTLQRRTVEEMRGRVMAVHSTCFLGSSLIGGPAFGWLAEGVGVAGALRLAASLCAVTAVAAAILWRARWSSAR